MPDELLWRPLDCGHLIDLDWYACAPGGVYTIHCRQRRYIVAWRAMPEITALRHQLTEDAELAVFFTRREILAIHRELELAKREAQAHYLSTLPHKEPEDGEAEDNLQAR